MSEPLSTNHEIGHWLTPRRFALLLAALVFAMYPQVFLGLQTFVFRDFSHCIYPMAYYLRQSLLHGEIPLWDPSSSCGVPFLAQWNVQALYPPALFYVLLPLSWSLGVFCLLHLYLGGLGMYFLARRWTGNNFAAAFAGIVFAFNGCLINSLMWQASIAGFGLMPWVILFTECAWLEGGRMMVWAAVIGALQMLSGAAEEVLVSWLILGVLGVVAFIQGGGSRWKIAWRSGTVILLVAGLSAAQMLPFLDFIKYSQRQGTFDPGVWPMPLTGWANFLVPLFHSNRAFFGVFMQPEQSWTNSYYVGVITIALTLWAVWRLREKRVWVLFGLTLLCLVLAWGEATPIYLWLRQHVGVIGLMRFPIKFVILPVFVLPLIAAYGLARKLNDGSAEAGPGDRGWWIIFGITVALIAILLQCSYTFKRAPEDVSYIVMNGVIHALLFVGMVALLWYAGKVSRLKSRCLLQLSVLLLVWLDLSHQAPLPPTINRSYYEPDLPRSTQPASESSRAMISAPARAELEHLSFPDPADDFLRRRIALLSNCNLLDHISKVDSSFSIRLKEHENVFYLLYDETATNPPPEPLLDFLGVTQINSATNLFEWETRSNAMLLITGGQRPVFGDKQLAFDALGSSSFDPRKDVYLPSEVQSAVSVTNNTAVQVSEVKFGAENISAHVTADATSLVVIAQNFYHPWHAYCDGMPVPLWHANYAFQAVQIPGGNHLLTLRYEDEKFHLGLAISAGALVGCVLIFLFDRRFSAKNAQPASIRT